MTKHQQVVAWAVSKIGEREEPPGSNRGPFVRFCQAHTWLKGTGWSWCAAFAVTAVEEGAGVTYPDPSAGAWDLLERARKRGWALGRAATTVEAGDFVVFDIGSGHVGVVEAITPTAVTSIDGNSGDQVQRVTRSRSLVRGFVAWPDDLARHARSSSPFAQIVGSVTGTRKLVLRGGVKIPLPAKGKVT